MLVREESVEVAVEAAEEVMHCVYIAVGNGLSGDCRVVVEWIRRGGGEAGEERVRQQLRRIRHRIVLGCRLRRGAAHDKYNVALSTRAPRQNHPVGAPAPPHYD